MYCMYTCSSTWIYFFQICRTVWGWQFSASLGGSRPLESPQGALKLKHVWRTASLFYETHAAFLNCTISDEINILKVRIEMHILSSISKENAHIINWMQNISNHASKFNYSLFYSSSKILQGNNEHIFPLTELIMSSNRNIYLSAQHVGLNNR
jgi:hypothetical protein